MLSKQRNSRIYRQRRGAIIVLVAVFLLVLFMLSALAINICYMQLTKSELVTATDAAARAGARELARSGDATLAFDKAAEIAAENCVAGQPLVLNPGDIVFGKSDRSTETSRYTFVANASPLNTARVRAHRDDNSVTGPVNLFMGNLLGTTSFQPVQFASATATNLDLCLVIDRSGSMSFDPLETVYNHPMAADLDGDGMWSPGEWAVGDPPPIPGNARWNGLMLATGSFFNKLRATYSVERVGAVVFSSSAEYLSDFTPNYALIENDMSNISPQGMTAIGEGIYLATDLFRFSTQHRPGAAKVMIVLTDGEENTGRPYLDAANYAASHGITMHAVAFSQAASVTTMDDIASIGGGLSLSAANNTQLIQAFNKIADTLPVLITE